MRVLAPLLLALVGCDGKGLYLSFDDDTGSTPTRWATGVGTASTGTGATTATTATTGTGSTTATTEALPVAVCSVDPPQVAPLYETATWIGSDSTAPAGGTLASWSWRLAGKPAGSGAYMPTTKDPDVAGFTADLAGTYLGRLEVVDDRGVASEPCEATLEVTPVHDIWIEMFWTEPDDDMDLHLLRPGGELNTDGDCYYGNCTGPTGPDWGVEGDPSDDPHLVEDLITGTGPEIIHLDGPEEGTYLVVVHDFPSSVWAKPNDVTVNIWNGSSLLFTETRSIGGEDSVTEFAAIDAPAMKVTPR